MTPTLRPATPADAAAMAAVAAAGFATYAAFAPRGWRVPAELETQLAGEFERRLLEGSAWVLVADAGGEIVGHAAFVPAADSSRRVDDPELAHLWQLFLAPPWWGTGLAIRLHDAALRAAAASGFTAMRLFTPAGQVRARRFYEREGWAAAAAPCYDERIGFDIVEYRRPLGERATRPARSRSAGSRPMSRPSP